VAAGPMGRPSRASAPLLRAGVPLDELGYCCSHCTTASSDWASEKAVATSKAPSTNVALGLKIPMRGMEECPKCDPQCMFRTSGSINERSTQEKN